ncbi:MAG: L-fucose/L-arabinose isomerase family protein [Patescibacteria group bacterium]
MSGMTGLTRIGLVAISDEREAIHGGEAEHNRAYLALIKETLAGTAGIEFLEESPVIHSMEEAVSAAKRMRAEDAAGVVMVHNMWTFAREAAIFARVFGGHVAGYTNKDPLRPALVGLLCSGGSIDKLGIYHPRIIGEISRPEVRAEFLAWARAAGVAHKLLGETYCNFGGRSMGMGTAVRDANDWLKRYGVDVEQIDQIAILERAKAVDPALVERAFAWLKKEVGYLDPAVPAVKIKNQIRLYEATKAICHEKGIDFYGIKCQPELSEVTDYAVPCLNQAFSNNDFDWDGPKTPMVCACEADMGAAMTMRLLQGLSGQPALFMDFRDYDEKRNEFIFCNCGSQSVFYARDLADVHLVPTDKYYPSGGAHVQYVCRDGEVTLARLCEDADGEWMAIIPGRFVYYDRERCKETSPLWPHAYLKANVDPDAVLRAYGSNHGHAVFGDWVRELCHLGMMLGFRTRVFDRDYVRDGAMWVRRTGKVNPS